MFPKEELDRRHDRAQTILDEIWHLTEECIKRHNITIEDYAEFQWYWMRYGLKGGWGPVEHVAQIVAEQLQTNESEFEIFKDNVTRYALQLGETGEIYKARTFLKKIKVDDKILLQNAHTYLYEYGQYNADAGWLIERYGEPEEIDRALMLNPLVDACPHGGHLGKVEDTYKVIRTALKEYLHKSHVPEGRDVVFYHLYPTVALQIEDTYDLVVGLLRSGGCLPNYLEPLNQPVDYIEYHRHWKREAVWRTHRYVNEVRKDAKILLCENDASTGVTMQAAQRKLDNLNPSQVDVCFTGIFYEPSIKAVNRQYYDDVFHITHFSQEHVYTDMLKYADRLEAAVESQEEKK